MAREPKMKIGIGADTGDFEKGARKVKQEMKDLDKVSSDAFASIGAALGIDTGKLAQFASAIGGVGTKFKQMGKEGTDSFGAILKSIGPVAAGIAGLGIAAAVAAFKQLNAEADAFERTIQGGAIKAQTDAYISTFRQSLRDQNPMGERFSEWRAEIRESWARLAGIWQSGFNTKRMDNAEAAGQRAKEIASELYDIDLRITTNAVEAARIDAQIAAQREIVADRTKATAERAAAVAEAERLIREKIALQLPDLKRREELIVEYNSLAGDTLEDVQAESAAHIAVLNLEKQESDEIRGIHKLQSSVNAGLQKTKEVTSEIVRNLAPLESLSGISGPNASVQFPTSLAEPQNINEWRWDVVASIGDIHVGVKFDLDTKKVQDFTREVESAMQGLAVNVGEILGQLAGDLATGGNAWGNFSNAAMSAFADMATAIGKIAIEAGIASLGIQAAITNLGGAGAALAISAGAALVALGAAVKAGLSNVASGNYSASSGVATSSYSSYNNEYETREVTVNVTGTLQADGDQLVAVIKNTQNNSYYQT